jgi:hypothetical protein
MKPNWTRLRQGYGVASSFDYGNSVGKRWTVSKSGCSVWRMWKTLIALLICVAPALAQEQFTAYDALRVVGVHINRDAVNHVVSMTGTRGTPQPQTWRIMIEDRGRGGIREVQVRNGQVVSDKPSSSAGSAEGATINTTKLNLDSSGAFAVASHTADRSATRFDSASYTLRTNERGEPTWIVTLHAQSGPVGTIYIGANKGTVTRTEGMFAGATMEDVVTEQQVVREPRHHEEGEEQISDEEQGDEEHGPLYGVRQRMRGYFQRAQEEGSGMFDRVRRSFTDFINR